MKKIIISLILIYTVSYISFSQNDTTSVDTLQSQDVALIKIKTADSTRTADSLEKEFLRRQIEELSKTEVKKRAELETKLNSLTIQDSIRKATAKREIDSLKLIAKGFPIVPYKDTLFIIYTKIGNVTAAERALIINERLEDLYAQFIPSFDSLIVMDYGQTVDIVYNDKTIISITEYDAMWFKKTKLDIAQHYREVISKDIEVYKDNTSLFTLLKQIGLAIFVIVLQVFLIRGVNIVFKRRLDGLIIGQKGKLITGIKIKDYQFLDEERQTNVILFISKILRWTVNLIQLYITIPILFSIFPPTRSLAETLFGYILSPLQKIASSFVNYLPNLFSIIVIVVVTLYILRFLRFLASEIEAENLKLPGFYSDWATPTFNIVRFLILAFMIVIIFPYLPGSDSPVFQGVSVFLGIMFSLGSSSVIGNMVAGLVMTYMRPFKIGDRIKIGDTVGDVVEKTPFVTRIKTPKKEYVTIPNSNVLSSHVVNYNTSKINEGIILFTTITIGYDVPWRQVHELLIDSASKTKDIMQKPEPFVLQTSLDDFYVSYQLNAYSDEPNKQPAIYSELHQNIQDAFNNAGVEILSPHYRGLRDGNQITLPPNYLPKDYEPPSFRIKK